MALRDRILNHPPAATATLATVATPRVIKQRTVAKVATVAVAEKEKKENAPVLTAWHPGKSMPENSAERPESPNFFSDLEVYATTKKSEAVMVGVVVNVAN